MVSPNRKSSQPAAAPVQNVRGKGLQNVLPVAAGAFLGLCLLKFGNPAIMEKLVSAPSNVYEFVFANPWPLHWAYWLLALVAFTGLPSWKWRTAVPVGLVLLPVAWYVWQLAASFHTVDQELTRSTLPHLAACTVCFYFGLFALSRSARMGLFWAGIMAGFCLLLVSAWQQRFGGLEETRKYFWTYIYPTLSVYPGDYIKKISSTRVFGTLFYPNTLAAAIILLFPALTVALARWTGGGRFTLSARGFILAVWTIAVMAALGWSGSKAGWLVMLAMALAAFFRWPGIRKNVRIGVVVLLLVGGLGGFFWTYAGFFKRGAPSVGARFDYWKAAVQNVDRRPLYGSGPGTFAVPYKELKDAGSEMSRLVHNDFLQQASDSGIPGFVLYIAFVGWGLTIVFRKTRLKKADPEDYEALLPFAVWLGLTGWFAHSLVDFHLYIPALAWAAFFLFGWLLGVPSALSQPVSSAQSESNV